VREVLARFIAQEVLNRPDLQISEHEDLLSTGLVDSLGIVSLVNFIEEETGLEVPPEDVTLENFISLHAIETYVRRRGTPEGRGP